MTKHTVSRITRRVALALFAGAVGLLALSLGGRPPTFSPSAQAAPSEVKQAPGAKAKDNYDLASLEIFRKVVVYIKDNYVDPKRIDPKEMFVAALEAIEKSTAEVMVEGTAKDGHVRVTCGKGVRDFDFKDIESIWMIPHRIRPVFEFIQANLVSTENKRDIEYAAINGMLTTLDPHSWLLKPDNYREMKLQTKGEFGGLGFVISMDEERLTVKKVLKNTPASRANIKKGDHISRIEDESTINMDLNEAVSKLRGKPGTEVRIFVKREKEEEKLYKMTRDLISIESVTNQLLADGVGYVRLSGFAGTTSRDLSAAIKEMKAQNGGKLKGLVMDLRSNPGGLLEQAYQVADQFIEEGTIVTTAGMSDKLREPKMARNDGNDRELPLAVIVNSESASASEIVAGALKNLNRAAIIGRQTFGKGSVQVLYDIAEPGTKEESALKLTIAQYLTPGDQSIQEIGVTPDIELLPARVTKERVDLFAPPRLVREADLDKHFSNGFQPIDAGAVKKEVEATDKPTETLRYIKEEKVAKKDEKGAAGGKDVKDAKKDDNDEDEAAAEEPDEDQIASDYQVEFARELVLRAPKTDRVGMLTAAKAFLAERRAEEDAKIEKAMETLGLDWTTTKAKPATAPTAQVEFKANPVKPFGGEQLTLTVTVANTGKVPYERLRAYTHCDAEKTAYQPLCMLLDRREFLFGKVNPGEKKTWATTFKVPNHLPAVHENLTLMFQDAHGTAPESQKIEVESLETPRPAFAFTYQVLDKDNLAEPGETVDVQVDVKNTGLGRARNTYVSLRNPANDKVFMKKGRIGLGELRPGETKTATLTLELKAGLDVTNGVPLKLEIGDRDMWEFTMGKIALPGAATAPTITDAGGLVKFDKDATVLAAPQAHAPAVAEVHRGGVMPVLAKAGEFVKVEWTKGRVGWLAPGTGTWDPQGKPSPKTETHAVAIMQRDPPDISLANADPTKAAVVVDSDRFKLSGVAKDSAGMMDVRIFVDNEKVYFHTAAGDASATNGKATNMPFTTEFPLKVGNNSVLIVAREDDDFSAQRTLVINRRAPAVAERKTPEAPPKPQ
jgi:carboxyl-terminal processing protease